MSKQIRLRAELINSTFQLGFESYILNLNNQNIVSVSITNQSQSPNNLLIGLNEDASMKIYLQAGESMSLGPYRDSDLLINNELRFAWDGNDYTNAASIIVSTEQEIVC